MRKIASLLFLVLIGGCASQTIEPSYYLLRTDYPLQTRALAPSRDFAMGTVAIAPYIDQPGLLLETQSGEIRPARYNLWAEPIYDGVRGFLLMEISQSKGEDILPVLMNKDAAVINVRIDQLHGTHDGQAKLVAYWWLARGDGILSSYLFAESRTLDSDGYAALAAAEKALLSELATRIAGSLVLPD